MPTQKTLVLLSLILPITLVATDAPTWTATGKNFAALSSQPFTVLLPTAIPQGYVLFDYQTEGGNYSVTYLKDKAHWFRIESTDTAGDVDWDGAKTLKLKSKRFTELTLQISSPAPGELLTTKKLITDWIPCPGAPKDPRQWPATCRYYHLFGYGLTPQQAAEAIESLSIKRP